MMSFGKTLQNFRKDYELLHDKKMSQAELGRLIGYSRNMVGLWERDAARPDRDTVLAIAVALDLDGSDKNELLAAAGYQTEKVEGEVVEEGSLSAVLVQRAARRGAAEAIATTNLSPETAPPQPIATHIPKPRADIFVGRETEKAWLRHRLLSDESAALVGLRAIGGMGKTELAIAVVRELEAEFPGGVFWLDCGPNDALAIQERLAQALGLVLSGQNLHSRSDALATALAARPRALVVLDDIRKRHLPDFEQIRPQADNCVLLITSRLDGFPFISETDIWKLEELPPEKGEELLAGLLQSYGITAEETLLAQIARMLEQIPLALTLAAKRAQRISRYDQNDPAQTLYAELEARRLHALSIGDTRKDLSVAITFDISYDDLEPEEQWYLAQLGLFARQEFDLIAAAATWDRDEAQSRTIFDRLGFAGLVEQTGVHQWWMHDLLREYAGERLKGFAAEQVQAARLRYAGLWEVVLRNLELQTVEAWQALATYRAEIVQAMAWLMADWQADPERATHLALNIGSKLYAFYLPQAVTWLQAGMNAAEKAGKEAENASIANLLAYLLRTRGHYDEAERLYRLALDAKEKIGDSRSVAVTQSSLADLLRTRGHYDEAERLYRLALDAKEKIGDSREVAVTQVGLADLLAVRGEGIQAEASYISCLEIFRELKDAHSFGAVQTRLAQLYLQQNRREEAAQLLQAARQLFTDLRAPQWVASIDQLLAGAQGGRPLTLEDLLEMVRAARQGDRAQGERAWEICQGLSGAPDPVQAALGSGLLRVLAGIKPDEALAALPEALRPSIIAALQR